MGFKINFSPLTGKVKITLLATFMVPLSDPVQWQDLSFSSLPKHELKFAKEGLSISVKQSAMPLIYPLQKPSKIKRIAIQGEIDKLLNLPKGEGSQWQKGGDDFAIKVGLVLKGGQTLGWLQKKVAPEWVLKLFSLAPKGVGVDKIYFLTAVQSKSLLGKTRNHSLKPELLFENNVWLLDKTGPFAFSYDFETPPDVLALWISVDGDDTKSSYNLKINKLELETTGELEAR